MRFKEITLLALAVLGLVIILITRAYVGAPSRDEIANLISIAWHEASGETIAYSGVGSFSLLPQPHFALSDTKIETSSGAELAAREIRFDLSLSDLITGKYRISSMTIDHAAIAVTPSDPQRDTTKPEKIVSSFLKYISDLNTKSPSQDITTIEIKDTTLLIKGILDTSPLHLDHATVELGHASAFTIDGTGQYQKIPLAMRASFDAADATKRARLTKFEYHDDTLKIDGTGLTAFDPEIQFVGDLNVSTENLNLALNRVIGRTISPLLQSASFRAKGRVSFTALTLSNMNWNIGGSKLSGNVIADFSHTVPRITGTLAASEIDLSSLTDNLGLGRDELGKWSQDEFKPQLFPTLDLDFRLSSDLVTIHDMTIKSVAISGLLQDQSLEIALVSADLFDGSVAGKINIASNPESNIKSIKTTLDFNQIDLERSLVALLDSKRATGSTSGRIALTTKGQSSAELIETLNGTVTAEAAHTTVAGINLLNFLHRIETRPLGATLALKGGTTEFDTAQFNLAIENGVGTLRNTNLTRLPDLQIKLSGQLNFIEQSFALNGHAIAASAQSADQSINMPFVLKGPFDNPAFLPDFMNISKQSGAIAP